MTSTPLRDVATRKSDVLRALESQGHYWLSTADTSGRPHVIGVSALWTGGELVVTTLGSSRTSRNIAANPTVVLTHGDPADAVVIRAEMVDSAAVADSPDLASKWKDAMGWDPREMDGWMFFRLRPMRIQAFRGYDEIENRDVMVRSRWLA
jgi:hypothetical protein